ncbi:hypothetical protein MFIFM68171_02940 [Madurella fahalii]|uniref:Clr5 domain-containing protein n=1 Tax=Madurella fahalii TaxID=1157608 RepID=A0ABQ0G4Q7_9PEZI
MKTIDWDAHRAEIERLYIIEKRTVQDIIGIMQATHGFVASKATYERKLKGWNIKKYKMGFRKWIQVERKMGQITKDKQREIYYEGVRIPPDKVRREISRYGTKGLTLREKYSIVTGKGKFLTCLPYHSDESN